jgi:uncharacterized protein (DUF433 family)
MPKPVSLTLNEAGYVVGQSATAINRAVDRGVIRAKLHRRGKHRSRQIGPAELRYLAIAREVEKDLTPGARKKVYEAVRRLPEDARRLDLGVMEFKLAEVDRRIAEGLDRLAEVKSLVDETGPEPLLRGTTVPVHVVAALARGQSVAEILADYPRLTPEQVAAAVEYAKIYPRPGRPLPARSFKRMLADLAASGVWELESDGAAPEPRPTP